uniref:Uncharacterized protein n=1 Tax=Populus trichocarpa TaxID=3694 RepID=A0A2K2A7R6_POPTR
MGLKFNSPFLRILVIAPLNDRNRPNSLYSGRGQLSKRGFRKCICVKKHSDWVAQAIRFSLFCGKDVELVRNAHGLGVECVKESFVQSVLTFENGDVAAQVRLKREHLNIAKFEPEHGLDPMLDLVLASVVRQMKASEMATQWTLLYHLTSRLRVLLQSAPSKRLFFEYYVKQLLKNQ